MKKFFVIMLVLLVSFTMVACDTIVENDEPDTKNCVPGYSL